MAGTEQAFDSAAHELCHRILYHNLFDNFLTGILVVNLSLVILETDAIARNDVQPLWANAISGIILVLFVLELVLRLYVLRLGFWFDGFNVFDFLIVVSDLALNGHSLLLGKPAPDYILQIARLSKLGRSAKAFRVFPELRVLFSRLIATFKSTFWRSMLLVVTLLAWSIVAVRIIHPLNLEIADRGDQEGYEGCSQAYASTSNAFFTFCQQMITTDGWETCIKAVVENYPWSVIFYAAVFMSVAMSMLNLVLGLVGDVASRLHEDLDEDVEDEHISQRLEVQRQLSHILELRKLMGGRYDRRETQQRKDIQEFDAVHAHMDIGEEDLRLLWLILDADSAAGQQAPHGLMAESLALDWGMQNLLDFW